MRPLPASPGHGASPALGPYVASAVNIRGIWLLSHLEHLGNTAPCIQLALKTWNNLSFSRGATCGNSTKIPPNPSLNPEGQGDGEEGVHRVGLPALRLPLERGEGPGHLLSHTRVSQVLQKNPAFLKLNVTHKRTRYRVSQHGHCTQFKEEARLPRPVKTRDSRGRARQGRQAASSWSFCTATHAPFPGDARRQRAPFPGDARRRQGHVRRWRGRGTGQASRPSDRLGGAEVEPAEPELELERGGCGRPVTPSLRLCAPSQQDHFQNK